MRQHRTSRMFLHPDVQKLGLAPDSYLHRPLPIDPEVGGDQPKVQGKLAVGYRVWRCRWVESLRLLKLNLDADARGLSRWLFFMSAKARWQGALPVDPLPGRARDGQPKLGPSLGVLMRLGFRIQGCLTL